MKRKSQNLLNLRLSHSLSRKQRRWLGSLGSVFVGLFMLIVCLWLVKPSTPTQAWEEDFYLVWSSLDSDVTRSVDLADWDGDGDLDLAVGNDGQPNRVYRNDGGVYILAWSSDAISATYSIAWGNWDNDPEMELAVGNAGEPNHVYESDGHSLWLAWSSAETDMTSSVAWGDWDNDGDQDLAVGNFGEVNRVYHNDGGGFSSFWSSADMSATQSVAWGNWDADPELELAVGNQGTNLVYEITGDDFASQWQPNPIIEEDTEEVIWVDWDGDGYLDLATGNYQSPVRIYKNSAAGLGRTPYWESKEVDTTSSIAAGDWDNDGDQDLAVGNLDQSNRIYRNDDEHLTPVWLSTDKNYLTWDVAWGDWDNDGDLDLVAGNQSHSNRVYANGNSYLSLAWSATDVNDTPSVAWGDWDNDGDLDLAVGNSGSPSRVYENQNGRLTLAWSSPVIEATGDVAWGDYDNDGDLDLAMGNVGQEKRIYNNENGDLTSSFTLSGTQDVKGDIVWGDWDNDGDLDLALNNSEGFPSTEGGPNRVYENVAGNFQEAWRSDEEEASYSATWGDWDCDGDLDLAIGNFGQPNRIYENTGSALEPKWETVESDRTFSVALGDWDNDGDLDLAVGNDVTSPNRVYENENCGANLVLAETWSSPIADNGTTNVIWGDWDGDDDLDLAVGNFGQPNQVYTNNGDGHLSLAWTSNTADSTMNIAWGDWDGDGDLDLAAGNTDRANVQVFRNNSLHLARAQTWSSAEMEMSWSVAWGDWDEDGDLDLVVGNHGKDNGQPNQIYRNEGGDLVLATSLGEIDRTCEVAWGDWDGDGDLDLAVGNWGAENRVYQNDDGNMHLEWSSEEKDNSMSIAWADWDGDGDLDLAVGNRDHIPALEDPELTEQPNRIYENVGGDLALAWTSEETDNTMSVAWGDWDGDGDPDLVVGNWDDPDRVYENIGGDLVLAWSSPEIVSTHSIDWGDWDEDGDLDLATGTHDWRQSAYIYENVGRDFILAWTSPERDNTWDVAWGDWDNDGDLDLAVANGESGPVRVYDNENKTMTLSWSSSEIANATDLDWGDWDNDGDLDLVVANDGYTQTADIDGYRNMLYINHAADLPQMGNSATTANITYPAYAAGSFFASATVLESPTIPITYTLYDPEGDAAHSVQAYYSLDGGHSWKTAVATTDTITTSLAASSSGISHLFNWDVYASNMFGTNDSVIFRIDVHQSSTALSNYSVRSAQTMPFRLRGSQIRVMDVTLPVTDAIVMRQPAGQSGNFEPYQDNFGQPFHTNPAGYLQGYGEIGVGDRLVAMLPITATDSYVLYYTSGTPSVTGLDAHIVTQPGVQTLVVSPDNPLLLFNLDLTLEWDARNDSTFLTELETGIQRASELLYDVSNGQIALGEVRVHQAKENWISSDIVLYGRNDIRPRASMGGVVGEATDDIGVSGVISTAYLPGQVRMGPVWDPFGQNEADLSQDWQRALAHELSHYLLYLPDNYLGIGDNGALITLNCQGSFMTNTYDDDYSEFLTPAEWQGDCLDTVAQHTTGRTDWETVMTFYEMLHGDGDNLGPARLLLNVTRVNFIEPADSATALPVRYFDLRDADSGALLSLPQAQGYLFRTQGTSDISDDSVMALGGSGGNGDRIMVRGADSGDRLCVFDNSADVAYGGCVDELVGLDTAVSLTPVPNWQPDILVTPINSRTLAITVTQSIPDDSPNVQVFPAYGSPDDPDLPVQAPWSVMTQVDANTFTQITTLDNPVFEGFVRVWVPGSDPVNEAMTQFFLSASWGPNDRGAWGPNDRGAWGANHRSLAAPVASGDGQVTIFNVDNIFADTGTASLQALSHLPDLPAWLTAVGQGYRFLSAEAVARTIAFEYLQRDVPDGYEYALSLYYLPDGNANWQRLDTQVDLAENLATARMPENDVQSQGIYVLAATVVLPSLNESWNLFGYPLPEAQPITTALASIEGDYTSVYHYDAAWYLYDATLVAEHPEYAPLVNNLTELAFGRGYWIYATKATTLYLGINNLQLPMSADAPSMPPATFYGPVPATGTFTPTAGMAVTAAINNNVCGQSTVQEWAGQFVYAIHVTADTGDGCGATGREITFKVEGEAVFNQTWDNSQAWYHPFAPSAQRVYLPIVLRGP